MLITSRDNPLIKQYRKLAADAGYRRETGLFAVEGARLCGDAVKSGIGIEAALVTEKAAAGCPELVSSLAEAGELTVISDSLAGHIGDTKNPQGIFCILKMPKKLDNAEMAVKIDKGGRYIALENIRDPGNLGGIIRTAEALGITGLLLSDGCCDIYNPKVLRSSMGGVFRLPIWAAGDMADTVKVLEQRGFSCYACVMDETAISLNQAIFQLGSICVIGNEANGLEPQTIQNCRHKLCIPMAGEAESLNAAAAATIVMWELIKMEN